MVTYRDKTHLFAPKMKSPPSQAHLSSCQSSTIYEAAREICSPPLKSFFIWTGVNCCIFSLLYPLSVFAAFLFCQGLFHVCALLAGGSPSLRKTSSQLSTYSLPYVKRKEHKSILERASLALAFIKRT